MVSKKMFHSIDELQKVQLLATQCIDEVGLQSSDGSVSVDAKSFIGMYALDFTQPIWACCDDPSFHKKSEILAKILSNSKTAAGMAAVLLLLIRILRPAAF